MGHVDGGSTSPTLLSEVSDWQDHPAWVSFRERYDPLLRRWCCDYGLDEDSVDEVCQRIWIELADRMRPFHYDPNRTFRGWLSISSALEIEMPKSGRTRGERRSTRARRIAPKGPPTSFGFSCLTRPR